MQGYHYWTLERKICRCLAAKQQQVWQQRQDRLKGLKRRRPCRASGSDSESGSECDLGGSHSASKPAAERGVTQLLSNLAGNTAATGAAAAAAAATGGGAGAAAGGGGRAADAAAAGGGGGAAASPGGGGGGAAAACGGVADVQRSSAIQSNVGNSTIEAGASARDPEQAQSTLTTSAAVAAQNDGHAAAVPAGPGPLGGTSSSAVARPHLQQLSPSDAVEEVSEAAVVAAHQSKSFDYRVSDGALL